MIQFKAHEGPAAGVTIDVLNHGMLAGHIRRPSDGDLYRYFRGVHNESSPSHEDRDLERLMRLISEDP
ncbi:MAG TPA: hypothetical protein VMG33_13310 [Steroidobacteraceae bacterium]|nr:hypothetical protein [Steroidobacteraceae bacterium]HUI60074.1 hypothetical protein [Steroidobacteraceae bacterium]